MSTLNELKNLYTTLKILRDRNLTVDKKLQIEVDSQEEKFIKEEILPVLTQNIQPLLNEIQRDIMLVVEHNPGELISVSITHKTSISDIVEAKSLNSSTESDNTAVSTETKEINYPQTRGKYTKLRVICPDGTVICEPLAKDTFAKAIKVVGVEKAMKVMHDTFFTTKRSPRTYDQVDIGGGNYLVVNNNNNRKKHYLDMLSQKYNLGWKVEVIK